MKMYVQKIFSDPKAYDERFNVDKVSEYIGEITFKKRLNLLSRFSNEAVLEIGCGTCEWLKHVNGFGLDISYEMLKACKNKGINDVVLGDAERLPFKSEVFDFVYCVGLFEYVNIVKVVREANRVLKKDRYFLAIFPNRYGIYNMQISLKNKILGIKEIKRLPSFFYVRRVLLENGFEIVFYESNGMVFYIPKGNKIYPKIKRFWRSLEWVNKIFDRVFPIGHSITVLVRKVE